MADIAYICDCKQCDPEVCANSDCTHTTDIHHAVNINEGKAVLFEKLPDGRLWETLRESQE